MAKKTEKPKTKPKAKAKPKVETPPKRKLTGIFTEQGIEIG